MIADILVDYALPALTWAACVIGAAIVLSAVRRR